jgi:DNA modification methylase
MEGQRSDMVFTDPPYNVAFNGRSGKFDVIKNDNLPEEQFAEFIKDWLQTFNINKPNSYYICCNWAFYGLLQLELKPKACIVWAKNVFGLGKGYRHQHEFILFDGLVDPDVKNETDLWQIAKDSKYVHPTQKPVALSERAIKNSTKPNNIVLDYFGGSGSTLIGCEKTGRKARVMELDPIYCDVIVKRWENFTGKQAVLAEL